MTSFLDVGEILRRIASGDKDLAGVSLFGADLAGAALRGANLRGASLRGANLHEADLREARLGRADLGLADVSMADLTACDLSAADFRGANLKGARFGGTTLNGASLRGADLSGAFLHASTLVRADLSRADLRDADLSQADLRGIDLRGADLAGANLKEASLLSATMNGADLRGADLTGATIRGANLTDTRLDGAILRNATVGTTVFADLDLRKTIGLEFVQHASPSTVGVDTLARSLGQVPESFLRGCGLLPWEILAARQYDTTLSPSALKALQAEAMEARLQALSQTKRLQISFAEADLAFVAELRRLLLARGVFAWVAAQDGKVAVRERQSKLAIHHDVALLLVLSRNSIDSDWVEHQIRLARKLEEALGESVLFPVALDDSWTTSHFQVLVDENPSQRGVLSFSGWQEKASMEARLEKLLASLAL